MSLTSLASPVKAVQEVLSSVEQTLDSIVRLNFLVKVFKCSHSQGDYKHYQLKIKVVRFVCLTKDCNCEQEFMTLTLKLIVGFSPRLRLFNHVIAQAPQPSLHLMPSKREVKGNYFHLAGSQFFQHLLSKHWQKLGRVG